MKPKIRAASASYTEATAMTSKIEANCQDQSRQGVNIVELTSSFIMTSEHIR